MRYLVTGGCGFIGSHLTAQLIALGHEVSVYDDLSTGTKDKLAQGATLIEASILDEQCLNQALESMDGCFHLAAIPSVERCLTEWKRVSEVNVIGTINVFEACRKQEKKVPVVYASSAATYGPYDGVLTENETPMQPISSYGVDKLACEFYGHMAWLNYKLPNIGLRFFNVYGPGQPKDSPYSGVITCFMHALENNQPLMINGDGTQTRDFIYVGDIARGCIEAMKNLTSGSETLNLCTGVATSVNDIAEAIAAAYDKPLNKTHRAARIGDVAHSLGSTKKLKNHLPDLPQMVSLTEGLRLTVQG